MQAPPTADPVALAASTAPAELAIEDLTRRTKEDLTNHMTGGLHLSGEFREIGGQHMFDLIPGACSMKASSPAEGEAAAATEWEELRETARVGVSLQS